MRPFSTVIAAVVVAALASCGVGEEPESGSGTPSIIVTTNILGDVVTAIVGDAAEVTAIMPVGANPHDFQASAQEATAMRSADLLITNGAGFEEGLLDVIEGAEEDGVPVVEAIEFVETLALEPEAHDDEEHSADEHGRDGADPHFFTDPSRMAAAINGISAAIVDEIDGVDAEAIRDATDDYLAELEKLDGEIESQLAGIDQADRVLVTNHEVFGYFADRYDFEIIGVVVPGGATSEGGNARDLARLVDVLREHRIGTVFTDASAPGDLSQTLADEVGNVEVVELFSESLGESSSEGATYLDMMRTNASRIAEALA